jgi:DNA polymerase-3 subunit gamma/tau
MGNFIVSARKYRPQKFSEVVGQESITTTLENALRTDHLAHAFLFCGPRGVGKTTCARILARTLNCENVQNVVDPCGECSSCKSFNQNASFNIFELDAASNNSVEDIRTLTEQVRFAPQQGKYKVYIIDEVHMLSSNAFNAFLKTLEEPPSHAIFILATTEKHKILPTILSRCQIFDFKRIQVKDTVKHLEEICKQEGVEAEMDALTVIAQKSDGALRDALSLFDRLASVGDKKITYRSVVENLNLLDYDVYFKTADACLREDVRDVLLIFDKVLNDGFEGDAFLNGLATHFRDLLVCQDPRTIHLQDHSETLKERYLDQAGLMSTAYLFSALNIINQTDISYPQAQNKRLHVEMALSKICFIGRATSIAPFQSEKKTADSTERRANPKLSTASQPAAGKTSQNENATSPTIAHVDEVIASPKVNLPEASMAQSPSVEKSPQNVPIIAKPIDPISEKQALDDKIDMSDAPDLPDASLTEEIENVSTQAPDLQSSQQGNIDSGHTEVVQSETQNATQSSGIVDDTTIQKAKETTDSSAAKVKNMTSKPDYASRTDEKIDDPFKGLTINIPKLGEISDIQSEIQSEEEKARANSRKLTLENLESWWTDCQAAVSSPSVLSTFKHTTIGLDGLNVTLECNSPLAQKRILDEIDLLPLLRKEFHNQTLSIQFVVIENGDSIDNQPKKPLTSKDKYQALVDKNELLRELKNRLDLAVDND